MHHLIQSFHHLLLNMFHKNNQNQLINHKLINQYKVDNYAIDLYFPEYKLALECDEKQHNVKINIEKDIYEIENLCLLNQKVSLIPIKIEELALHIETVYDQMNDRIKKLSIDASSK